MFWWSTYNEGRLGYWHCGQKTTVGGSRLGEDHQDDKEKDQIRDTDATKTFRWRLGSQLIRISSDDKPRSACNEHSLLGGETQAAPPTRAILQSEHFMFTQVPVNSGIPQSRLLLSPTARLQSRRDKKPCDSTPSWPNRNQFAQVCGVDQRGNLKIMQLLA